ncbi:interleukin-12 subunit alpha [Trematomus bernacchii]|uniref:interleukin-12 subunit alpha n=1 Tax=Trematomus bernacchii TaxID=40690 RepID=UPI00146AE325|nr:interleukin-12 subunit alpha [Trematomus bernacchii]
MSGYSLYSASCLILLLLSLSWRTSTGLPVRTGLSAEKCADCSLLFKKLLLNISELLKDRELFHRIDTDASVVISQAETVLACAPTLTQNSTCMMQRNSTFSESECLGNIMKDLAYYSAVIQSYTNSDLRLPETEVPLLNSTLEIIRSLRKSCSLTPNGENNIPEDVGAPKWENSSYENRQQMFKMMKGFQVRTITINRALGYISSGDHRK